MKVKLGGPPFLAAVANARIVSPKAVRENERGGDLAQDYLNRFSAGTGPYRITGWQRNQRITLEKFNDYWRGWKTPNHFTRINMLVIPENNTQRLMLEKGELDMAFKFPTEALPSLERNPNIQVIRSPGIVVTLFRLQHLAPPTNDVRVRRAINYAFDFESWSKTIAGTQDAPYGPVPAVFLGNWKPQSPYAYNVTRAKQLLNEAGYNENRKARLIADIALNAPEQRKAIEILQAGLRATGAVEMEIRETEFQVSMQENIKWAEKRDPATAHHIWSLNTPARMPDAYAYLWYLYSCQAAGRFARNPLNHCNLEVDRLIDLANAQTEAIRRYGYYRQATQVIVDTAADLFLGTQSSIYLLRKDIRGFFPHPTWYPAVQVYHLSRR
jgi:glutathione transport system substrate-binding protein